MKKYLWASIHKPIKVQLEQLKGNIIYLKDNLSLYNKMINNDPDADLKELALELLTYAKELSVDYIVQPSGSPAFQLCLGVELGIDMGTGYEYYSSIGILYAYSVRVSEDITQEDGTVKKVSIFKHEKFIEC